MASRIEGYDEKIIECSQKEFLEKGYNEASLRNIAKAAGVSTSTIYTRFGDKEGMFQHLIQPTEKLCSYLNDALRRYFSDSDEDRDSDAPVSGAGGFDKVLDMIYEDYEAYKLLVSRSPGNMYKTYLERVVSLDMKFTLLYLQRNNNKAIEEAIIDEGFCKMTSTAFYSALFYCVEHDLSRQEAGDYFSELVRFYGRGWSGYL